MRYYLIAGEASGDLHGSNLMKEIKTFDKTAGFRFFGGNLMQEVEDNIVKHYREMAFMGIVNVLRNIRTIKRNLDLCKKDILKYSPDVVILIDYPGFNMKIAEFAKENGIKVFYYISPKVWAWKSYRVKKIKAFVDEMFTILPFEKEFFKNHNYNVHYVGNPILDSIKNFKKSAVSKDAFLIENGLDNRPIIALLAGSRKQEVRYMLPVMLKVAEKFPGYQYVISGVSALDKKEYQSVARDLKFNVVYDKTYDLLNNSYAALVASGTATLETALFNIPQLVLYRIEGSWFVYYLMKYILGNIKMISLPNIILKKEAIKEFIQHKMNEKRISPEFNKLLNDNNYRKNIYESYVSLNNLMGKEGSSNRAANIMVELLSGKENK